MAAPDLRLQRAIAVVLRLTHDLAATQARVLLPETADTQAAMVSLEPHGPLLVELPEGVTEVPHEALPHGSEPDVELPDTPELRAYPPFEVDVESGTVTGTIGGLDAIAAALALLAGTLGDGAVIACDLRTTDPHVPLGLAARPGEPVVALLGDDAFELTS